VVVGVVVGVVVVVVNNVNIVKD